MSVSPVANGRNAHRTAAGDTVIFRTPPLFEGGGGKNTICLDLSPYKGEPACRFPGLGSRGGLRAQTNTNGLVFRRDIPESFLRPLFPPICDEREPRPPGFWIIRRRKDRGDIPARSGTEHKKVGEEDRPINPSWEGGPSLLRWGNPKRFPGLGSRGVLRAQTNTNGLVFQMDIPGVLLEATFPPDKRRARTEAAGFLDNSPKEGPRGYPDTLGLAENGQ